MELKKTEQKTVRLAIDGYGTGGEGVARLPDGMTCFVRGGLRGEICLVRLDKVGKSAAWGHVERVLAASPGRIAPECPYYGSCGGCMTQHMTYEEELDFKRQKVEDCLRRIGGTQLRVSAVYGAKNPWRYRNKVQFPVSDEAIGFYAARSHRVIGVEDCLLQPEVCGRVRAAVREYMAAFGVSAYDERAGKGLLRHLYVRTNQRREVLCCLLVNGKELPREDALVAALRAAVPELRGVVLGRNERRNNVILGEDYRALWGDDFLMDRLGGLSFRLSVPSFYQINASQAEVLYNRVMEFAGLTGRETVLDLYCGIGTITLYLAGRAGKVIGAEEVPEAIADARENALRNGIGNAEFFCGDAGEISRKLAANGVRPEVITVDPPRKGLAENVVETISDMRPERMVYVSCDPATLARDIRRFAERGYRAERAEAVDMFPRTSHVETVVTLRDQRSKRDYVYVDYSPESSEYMDKVPPSATYPEIKAWILETYGFKTSSLYIAQVKAKHGLIERENYNKPKSENSKQPQCPPEKEQAIEAALRHFRLIEEGKHHELPTRVR